MLTLSRGQKPWADQDDEKWKVNIYCRMEGKEMVLFKDSVKEIRDLW